MKTVLSLLVLSALILVTAVPRAFGDGLYSRNEFKQRWIGFHEELTPRHLEQLFAYMETDGKTAKMLGDLRRVTGKQSALELMAVISLCVDNEGDFKIQMRGPSTYGEASFAESGQRHSLCLS
ncbi:MAG: hypothetical protein HY074_15250, partial [Deltaproteobacteria bacterium]|nr:hypothetical protein [Deltaproteobacteria bacterium]